MINNSFYYSKRLNDKLERIKELPTTIVAAPTGYGKTSVVHKITEQFGMKTIWMDAEDTTPQKSYARLCQAFSKTGSSCGNKLEQLGFPNIINSFEVANCIYEAKSDEEECILVIDNFQFLQADLPANVLSAFSRHQGSGLHIVILTNLLWESFIYEFSSAMLIGTEDFSILPEEILEYFHSQGVMITPSEADRIFNVTNGWGVAVFLHLNQYFRFGVSINDNNTIVLIEELIWKNYNRDMKDCMLNLAPFERFDEETICYMLNCTILPLHISETLRSTPLILYDLTNRLYYPHKIVTDFFRAALDCRPKELKDGIYNRAGDRFLSIGNYKKALECYDTAENYEKILSLDHRNINKALMSDEFYASLANKILDRTPWELRSKYPMTMLSFARLLFVTGDYDGFQELIQEVCREAEKIKDLRLLGEAVLISAWEDFPDIFKMKKKYQEAAELLEGFSDLTLADEPYMFGCPSMLSLFLIEAGTADSVAEELESAVKIYSSITGGHGKGADLIFRGELALMRNQYDEALILAYKAENIAEEAGQYTIMLGSALLKGSIAIAQKDKKMLDEAINYINNLSSNVAVDQLSKVFTGMVDMTMDLLLCASEHPRACQKDCFMGNLPLNLTSKLSFFTAMFKLIQTGQFAKLIGIVETICEKREMSAVPFALYSKIFLAISYGSINRVKTSQELLESAFQLAQPDQLIMPFAIRMDALSPFMSKDLNQSMSLLIDEKASKITPLGSSGLYELTLREREIAKLASQGMRNREIANTLYLSEGTVRNHLSIVFQKLGIDRRSKLADYADIL